MRGRPGQTAWRMVGRGMRWTGTRLFVWGEDSWERKEMWKEAYAAALGKGSAMFFRNLALALLYGIYGLKGSAVAVVWEWT